MSIKGAIFDLDGTLFDSMSIWESAGTDYLASLGYVAEKDLSKKLKTMSLMQSAAYLKENYNLPLSISEIIDGVNKTVEDYYFYHAMPKDHVISLLSDLQSKGIKMCVATAIDSEQAKVSLKRCDMLDYFDEIFTCNEIGHGKDEPYIFEAACKAMGTNKNETAVFEDAYHSAKTAKDAGFYVVGVYDRYEKRMPELKELADVYLDSFFDAQKLLRI
ncbi:MAG: HAD family phosphatase [Erysipelotrichaceae bacterium]|nr:HAD family phosphatase [Erysipelotrichaceae bacterium]